VTRTYAVIGLKEDSEQTTSPNLTLDFDADRMSNDERKAAADALRSALESLEKRGND
jgi:hypothetical protein